jgi:DNA (cytosine-5)-methyltransferase 1
MFEFYEFFAGGGMVRAGLGAENWHCRFANDFDEKKGAIYQKNWKGDAFFCGDVRKLKAKDVPGNVDLAWASFPCQDLSLAGGGAGLKGDRSGTFWPFWNLMELLIAENRAPKIIALENVCGTLTSHGGKDFGAICSAFQKANYKFGALVVDASHFVPHSRPRLFIIGVRNDIAIPAAITQDGPSTTWHTRALCAARDTMPIKKLGDWIWWALPTPPQRNSRLSDLIETRRPGVDWHSKKETNELLEMMSPLNRAKVEAAKKTQARLVGAIYKRTRVDAEGYKVQRAEIRFDDIAGCLRTPAGGSSRQLILVVEGSEVRSRLIAGRETARLMGLPDNYVLPENYNETYHLTGDGVVVPVVRHLAENIFERILLNDAKKGRAAA